MTRSLALLFAFAAAIGSAEAGEFAQSGDSRWTVCRTSASLDQAIGYARQFGADARPARVLKREAGDFAVVLGPAAGAEQERQAQSCARWFAGEKTAPTSTGNEFVAQAWTSPKTPALAQARLEAGAKTPARAQLGDYEIEIAPIFNKKDESVATIVTLRLGARTLVKRRFSDEAYQPNGSAMLVRLDPSSPAPQFVINHFGGGAHCCTEVSISTASKDGRWRTIEAGSMDGSAGYALEDIDGDGAAELIGSDDSMLYAFSSYAGSYPPPRIKRFENGSLKDVSEAPAYRTYLRQSLLRMEGDATTDDWKASGFLAGWVAAKSMVGEGAEAWARMLTLYDKSDMPTIESCKDRRRSVEKCPERLKLSRQAPFPEALKDYLATNGYAVPGVTGRR